MQQQLPQQHEARRIRCLLVASCAAGELGGRMWLQQRWELRLAFSQPVYLSRQMYLPVLSVSVSVSAAAVDVSASGSAAESVDISAWEMRNFCLFNANASRDAPSPPTRHQFSITRAHTPSLSLASAFSAVVATTSRLDLLRTCCATSCCSWKSLCSNFCIFSWRRWPPKWCQQLSARWLMSYSSGNVFHLPLRAFHLPQSQSRPTRRPKKEPTKRLCQQLTNWPRQLAR